MAVLSEFDESSYLWDFIYVSILLVLQLVLIVKMKFYFVRRNLFSF